MGAAARAPLVWSPLLVLGGRKETDGAWKVAAASREGRAAGLAAGCCGVRPLAGGAWQRRLPLSSLHSEDFAGPLQGAGRPPGAAQPREEGARDNAAAMVPPLRLKEALSKEKGGVRAPVAVGGVHRREGSRSAEKTSGRVLARLDCGVAERQ